MSTKEGVSLPTRHFFSRADNKARASCSAEGRDDGLDLAASINAVACDMF